jgi:pseudouridine-5'-phosphate glycosidase
MPDMIISEPVQEAMRADRPIVALESTIFSNLGLPSPSNEAALTRTLAAVHDAGAEPAVTAIMDGFVRVGLEGEDYDRILGEAHKTAERDIPAAISQKWPVGATTVSASLAIAAVAGIEVFATGGIGGVHHGSADTGDISADLGAIARHAIVTVCAGAKAFLDISGTLEHLEMLSVPVVGYRTDDFPMFYARSSGFRVPLRLDSTLEIARLAIERFAWNSGGVLVGVPIPASDALSTDDIQSGMTSALAAASQQGITGAAVTPFVLGEISRSLDGLNIPANLALSENNAAVAADIAVSIASMS